MLSTTCPYAAPTFAVYHQTPHTGDDEALDRLCSDPNLPSSTISRAVIRTAGIVVACSFTITIALGFFFW